jgi:uncharacterized protein (DUF983 family)
MSDHLPTPSPERPIFASLMRGLRRRCPQCGDGTLLAGYLTPVKTCGVCGEDFSAISADDGPAWATLLVLGHVVVPLMVVLGRNETIPIWLAISILMVVMLAGVYVLLPRAKGLFVALIWATGATGEDYTAGKTQQDRSGTASPFEE